MYPNQNKWYTEQARKMIMDAYHESKYSIAELAKKANMNYSNLQKYFCFRNDIRTGDFLALCLVLKIDLSRFNNSKY